MSKADKRVADSTKRKKEKAAADRFKRATDPLPPPTKKPPGCPFAAMIVLSAAIFAISRVF